MSQFIFNNAANDACVNNTASVVTRGNMEGERGWDAGSEQREN